MVSSWYYFHLSPHQRYESWCIKYSTTFVDMKTISVDSRQSLVAKISPLVFCIMCTIMKLKCKSNGHILFIYFPMFWSSREVKWSNYKVAVKFFIHFNILKWTLGKHESFLSSVLVFVFYVLVTWCFENCSDT